MDKIIIEGKADLFGSINVNGSKNAALPILVSSLLSEEDLELNNLPELEDVNNMKKLLSNFGVLLKDNSNNLILNAKNISNKVTQACT